MDRVAAARAAVDATVRRVGGYFARGTQPGIEPCVVADAEHGQYGLFLVGWEPVTRKRVFNTVFLARLKDGKVWIEEDNTDWALADDLVRAGVPKEDIVLAFQPPELRHLTEFAVA